MSQTVRSAARRTRRPVEGRLRDPRTWRVVAGVVVPALVAVLAVVHPGAPVSQVDLNDGAVWLTNTDELKLGRYNAQVDELNAGLIAEAAPFDVLQDELDVVLVEDGRLSVVDPASVSVGAQATVPFGTSVWMSGGTVAVTQPTTGDVWARPVDLLGTLDIEVPDLELGPGGAAVVARDGTILAVDADGALQRARPSDDGVAATADGEMTALPGPVDAVTAVGDRIAVLSGSTLVTPDGTSELAAYGDDLALQQPGPRSDVVLVATPDRLLEVPLDGGKVREHPTGGAGAPAQPVRVGACAHGAWASPVGSSVVLCDGGEPVVADLEQMTADADLVFRVNRDVVVLNDTRDGRLWVPSEDPRLREPNWQDIQPQDETREDEENPGEQETVQNLQPECGADSAPPIANEDTFGVRAGRTTILSVIDNDASSDCGILTISEHDADEAVPDEFGEVVPVHGGRAFQLTTAPGASGSVTFTYTVTDGRGTTAPSTADVTLEVHGADSNGAPVQVREGEIAVEQGATVQYDVLPDFRDPDGDPLLLVGAAVSGGGSARVRQDGMLTFESDGGSLGAQTITVTVSDGELTVEGRVVVQVRPAGSLPPVIEPVHAQTYVDETVVVRPLDSVRSVSREPVRLAGVEELPGATIRSDLAAGTFTFTAAATGTYYVPFVVTAGPQQATGLARIDVTERPDEPAPPVAVLDTALLPPGGTVTIDPLANDLDPAGGVLVLQSVSPPAESRLEVAVLQHALLQISSDTVLTAPVVVPYTVSNGTQAATGQVLVVPGPPATSQQPPVVPNVTASVRTGGVVTVDVLAGAFDPDGDRLTLVPELAEPLGADQGLLFVSEGTLRFQAPSTPQVVEATFTVRDPADNRTSATLTVDVHASDADTKAPPRPKPLTARVFAGEEVRIPVPLTGIDPDGDGVYLLGPDEAPGKGIITEVGADYLVYEALDEVGTDTFTYAVEDWVGQRAVATVRVGITERPSDVAQVISRPDDVTVRPGQSVEVRVLANDVDMSGGELALGPAPEPRLEHDPEVVARIEGRRVVVEAPTEPGTVHVGYTAVNERGGSDSSVLSVHVSDDARVLPPIAQDVVVPAKDTINRTTVEVDVLALAENPSGPMSDLEVGVHESASEIATVTAQGAIVVTLTDTARTFPYRLTNTSPAADGASTYAFITVPALGDFPPMPRPGADPLTVVAGQPLTIKLEEQVLVAPGREARVADRAGVTATKSDGSELFVDDRTLRYTADPSYAGPASISFPVTDGTTGEGARRQLLTLPITVLAAEDHPPTFLPSALEVAPGESVSVDLRAFTSATVGDDDEGEYTYRLSSPEPGGFDVSVDGTRLTIAAAATVPRGSVAGVSLEIGYGEGRSITGQVNFQVIASKRPLARVVARTVEGVEGGSVTVPVLSDAYNPFAPEPLSLVDAVVETPGAGTAAVTGQQVTARPAAGFIGTMVVRFRVRDVTGDAAREVEGRLTVNVVGRPAPPTAPRIDGEDDRTVTLRWDAPAANGSPITGYRVTASPGGLVQSCPGTACQVTGLTNGQAYTFVVEAQNAVGWSDKSPASPSATPDVIPGAPPNLRATRGDTNVTLEWGVPTNTGTPVERYLVSVSPAAPAGAVLEARSTGLLVTGLANGTEYSFSVVAVNKAGESDPSNRATATPAGRPPQPQDVSVTTGRTGVRTATVSWNPPVDDNGADILGYRVLVDGEWVVAEGGGGARSHSFTVAFGQDFSTGVIAFNAVGDSPAVSASGAVWDKPTPVQGLQAADAAGPEEGVAWGDGSLRISWQAPAESGTDQPIPRYRVQVSDGPDFETDDTSVTVGDLVGGPGRTVTVWAQNSRDEWSDPVSVTSGPVTTAPQKVQNPTADTTTPGQVVFRWAPGGSGGLATQFRYQVERQGEGQNLVTGTTSDTGVVVPMSRSSDQWMRITVWAVNSRGESESVTWDATGVAPPPPPEPEPTPAPTG